MVHVTVTCCLIYLTGAWGFEGHDDEGVQRRIGRPCPKRCQCKKSILKLDPHEFEIPC